MDTRPDEDETLMAFDPLDVVEHVLTAENLTFDRTEDGDLAFALAGDWKDYELWFAWRPEADCLQLCLSMDLTTPKEGRGSAAVRRSGSKRLTIHRFEKLPLGTRRAKQTRLPG